MSFDTTFEEFDVTGSRSKKRFLTADAVRAPFKVTTKRLPKIFVNPLANLANEYAKRKEDRVLAISSLGLAELAKLADAEALAPLGLPTIAPAVVDQAAELLTSFADLAFQELGLDAHPEMPSILPTGRGGIQFEWHRNSLDVELEILPTGRIQALVERAGQESQELDVTARIDQLRAEFLAVLTP